MRLQYSGSACESAQGQSWTARVAVCQCSWHVCDPEAGSSWGGVAVLGCVHTAVLLFGLGGCSIFLDHVAMIP
jgi:hypothetical protein